MWLKTRESTSEQASAETNLHLQHELNAATAQVSCLQAELASAYSQHSQQAKVTPLTDLSNLKTMFRLPMSRARHDICRHNYSVERGLVVSFCGQPHYCYRPYYLIARVRPPLSYMVADEPFPDRSRPMSC